MNKLTALGLASVLLLFTAGLAGGCEEAPAPAGFCTELSIPNNPVACLRTSSDCKKNRIKAEQAGVTTTECSSRTAIWCFGNTEGENFQCFASEEHCLGFHRLVDETVMSPLIEVSSEVGEIPLLGECSRYTSFPGKLADTK